MGWTDVPLNDNGRAQAGRLSKTLQGTGLEIIYSSPLSRTFETAKIVAEPNNTEIMQNDALKERNNGIIEGSIPRIDFPDFDKKMDDPDFAPPGGESTNQLRSRVLAAIDDIIKNSDKKIIGISTSNGVAMIILKKFAAQEPPRTNMPNSEYYRLDWDGENLKMNETPQWLDAAYKYAASNVK